MAYEFSVSEEKGDKLYKLIIIRLQVHEGIKIVSKEDFYEKIHFCIYMGALDPHTKEFVTRELKYKSVDEGIEKGGFESLIQDIINKLPEGSEVIVNDLSGYRTLKEQFKEGLNKNVMKVVSVDK